MSLAAAPDETSAIACDFTRGYVDAAFFSTMDGLEESGGEPLEVNYSTANLAPQTWAAIQRDCAAFLAANGELIEALEDHHRPGSAEDNAMSHAGRDFWFVREGHGAGFWDGDWPEAAGEHLSEAARAFGAAEWYFGDDGQIYQFGAESVELKEAPALASPDPSVFPGAAPGMR